MSRTVYVRYGREKLDPRELVRPHTLMLREWRIVEYGRHSIRSQWEWVVANIAYPWGTHIVEDWHEERRYRLKDGRSRFENLSVDFWNYPSETMRDRVGDCEDRAILLASLLRTTLSERQVWVTVGKFRQWGHVWVSVATHAGWEVLETTLRVLPRPDRHIMEGGSFKPVWRFNDRIIQEVSSSTRTREGHDISLHDPRKRSFLYYQGHTLVG